MKKIGIVELQTTSVKLVIAEILENQSFVITDRYEDRVKVATDMVNFELIKPATIASVSSILKSYKAILTASGIEDVQFVATNEYAEAKNQRSFFEELYSTTGFRFKILTAEEEQNYLYLSFSNTLDCPKGIAVGLNGTNVQLTIYNRRNILGQVKVDLGSYHLAEKYIADKKNSAEIMKQMCDEFSKKIAKLDCFEQLDPETQIVGTGDVFLGLAKLSKKVKHYPYNRDHAYQLVRDDFDKVYDFLNGLEIDNTKKLKGISTERADIIASGLSIIKAISDKSAVNKFIVAETGIAEAIILLAANPTLDKPMSDVLGNSLDTLNLYYNKANIQNTKNVYDISIVLFKQLKVLHKLPRNYVKVLRIASYLNDCGKRISAANYEKKGFNVVLESDIYGVNHHEQVLAAFTVACQKLEDFSMTDWVRYSSMLTEADLDGVRKLAIIVRLASKLDMFNTGKVRDICCDILGDSVIMKTIVESPAEMEIAEGKKVAVDFAKAFKKHLEIL